MTAIGLLSRRDLSAAAPALRELVAWLKQRGVAPWLEQDTAALLEPAAREGCHVAAGAQVAAQAELLVVLGGDGTLLSASALLAGRPVPVLGVNFGSLGFLTEVALSELYPALESVLAGRYQYEERRMLQAVVRRAGGPEAAGDVLNDVVIAKGALARIIELHVSVGGVFVSAFRADGLIISSPTGSTAYNLAAGGPILHPALPAVVLTPICPHMLTNRPLVVPDDSVIEVRLADARDVDVRVSFDGQRGAPFGQDDTVTVTRSPRCLRLVKSPARDYFEVLRTKLKWGEASRRRS